MQGKSRHFSARVVFSGDCPVASLQNAFPKEPNKISVGFRDDSEFVCADSEQTKFIAACSADSKWSTTSTCLNSMSECEFNYPVIRLFNF